MTNKGKKKIGIFGGSFNPFHLGHLNVLLEVQKSQNLDSILVIPAACSPFKNLADELDYQNRLKMVKIGLEKYQDIFKVDDREIRRGGISYTFTTVEEISQENQDAELQLIVGIDQFESFDQWFNFEGILACCDLIVVGRPNHFFPSEISEIPDGVRPLVEAFEGREIILKSGKRISFESIAEKEISSDTIRSCLRKGQDVSRYLALEVESYITKERLYQPLPIEDSLAFSRFCLEILDGKKAINCRAFDLRKVQAPCECAVIASGTSTRHASALGESLLQEVRNRFGILPQSIEGLGEGRWVLLDYGSVMVHLFYDFVRMEYRLEDLWSDGDEFFVTPPKVG